MTKAGKYPHEKPRKSLRERNIELSEKIKRLEDKIESYQNLHVEGAEIRENKMYLNLTDGKETAITIQTSISKMFEPIAKHLQEKP